MELIGAACARGGGQVVGVDLELIFRAGGAVRRDHSRRLVACEACFDGAASVIEDHHAAPRRRALSCSHLRKIQQIKD